MDSIVKMYDMSILEAVSAFIELTIFSLAFYVILRFLHGTRGLGIMKGILALLVVVYFTLNLLQKPGSITQLYLPRLNLIADQFLTVIVLGMVVVFQPEIRRGLSRLGEVGLFGKGEIFNMSPVTQGMVRMARKKIGALIVIQRTTGLGAYTENAVKLNAEVSASILESIFFPNSPLHDGAVLIQRNRIVAACCLLPLSEKPDLPPGMGTRHRAALGISEESDAVALVVSEETGQISVALRGEIHHVLNVKDLETRMNDILFETNQGESAV